MKRLASYFSHLFDDVSWSEIAVMVVAAWLMLFSPFVPAQNQRWYCDKAAEVATEMARSFETFQPEHYPNQKVIAEWALACVKAGNEVKACVHDRCMKSVRAGAMLTPQQARSILVLAYGQFGGPPALLDNPPPIAIVDQDWICGEMHRPPGCTFVGMFDGATIFLSDRLNFASPVAASALLHEYVHYFQEKTRGPIDRNADGSERTQEEACREKQYRERQAYQIQAHVLERAGEYEHARAMAINGRRRWCGE